MPTQENPADGMHQFWGQAAAFQKLWLDSAATIAQAALAYSPQRAPPTMLREVRTATLKGLAQAWDQFLRSPEFGLWMRQWLDQAITIRQAAGDLLTKAHHDVHAPAQQDIDTLLIGLRHLERRLLDELLELTKRVTELEASLAAVERELRSAPTQPRAKKKRGRKEEQIIGRSAE